MVRVWCLDEEEEKVECILDSKKGQLQLKSTLGEVVQVFKGNDLIIEKDKLLVKSKSSYGYVIARIKSLLEGVQRGYYLELELVGRGYRFINLTNFLVVKLGSLYGLQYKKPTGVHIFVSKTKLVIFGVDLEEVNRVGNVIRGFKRPDAYKGKGIRIAGEVITLKAGKK